MGNRGHVHFVEGNVGVCLSSNPSLPNPSGKDKKGAGIYDSSSSVVAKESLVAGASRDKYGASKGTSIAGKTAVATEVKYFLCKSEVASASRLVIIA